MASGTIQPQLRMFFYTDTTPSTYTEFRKTVPNVTNSQCMVTAIQIQNGSNNAWYQAPDAQFDTPPFMNGSDLRFKLKNDQITNYGGMPFRAIIVSA